MRTRGHGAARVRRPVCIVLLLLLLAARSSLEQRVRLPRRRQPPLRRLHGRVVDMLWTCRGRVVGVSWVCRGRVADASWRPPLRRTCSPSSASRQRRPAALTSLSARASAAAPSARSSSAAPLAASLTARFSASFCCSAARGFALSSSAKAGAVRCRFETRGALPTRAASAKKSCTAFSL